MKQYTVVFIDQEDPQDTTIEFHFANNEDELEENIKRSSFGNDDDEPYSDDEEEWTNTWGFTIVYKEIEE